MKAIKRVAFWLMLLSLATGIYALTQKSWMSAGTTLFIFVVMFVVWTQARKNPNPSRERY